MLPWQTECPFSTSCEWDGDSERRFLELCEINQCVGCAFPAMTRAALAPSSGEEPASPRHRAGVASMATQRRCRSDSGRENFDFHTGESFESAYVYTRTSCRRTATTGRRSSSYVARRLAAGGGIGKGGLLVPIYRLVAGFPITQATALSCQYRGAPSRTSKCARDGTTRAIIEKTAHRLRSFCCFVRLTSRHHVRLRLFGHVSSVAHGGPAHSFTGLLGQADADQGRQAVEGRGQAESAADAGRSVTRRIEIDTPLGRMTRLPYNARADT